MNRRDSSDEARLAIAIATVIAAIILVKWTSSIHPAQLLATAAIWLVPLALGTLAIASALAPQRFLATRRALRKRIITAVVPADEFEAKPEEVLRFAAELARADRGLRGWLDRRASALRVALVSDRQGRLVYLLDYPARSQELVRAALRSYEGVEVRESADVLPGWPQVDRVKLRTELVPAHPSIEPLARLELVPDPLQPFAAAMESLRPAEGERVWVFVDLLAASPRRASRLRARLKRQAKRRYAQRRSLAEILNNERRKGPADPTELHERRMVGEALNAKLHEAGPLFEAQILLCAEATGKPRAKTAMQLLLAAFAPSSARNWLRPSGLGFGDTVFFGSDFPTRRRSFDRRWGTSLHRSAKRSILTAREVAGFLKPPTAQCVSRNVVRSGTLLGAPPSLPTFEQDKGELIPLGRVGGESGKIVAARTADTFFTYIAGRSRYGKTETAIAQFVHLVRSGAGGLFLDPHGDALERIRPYLSEAGVAERVVELDVSGRSREAVGWNLFELRSGEDDTEAEARVAAIVDAFASTLKWDDRSTRAINLTTQAASALAHIAKALPPELAPTIFQLPALLSKEEWREAALPFLPQSSRDFWEERFPRLTEEAITPVTNLVDRLRTSASITALLGQSQGSYRVREAMDQGWIVLAHPGGGDLHERLLANLILFDLLRAAKARGELAASRRRPFWVFLDEVQSYDSAASGTLAALLEQSAKFGLRAVVLNQNPDRLNPKTLTALTTNRSHLLATTMNSHAAALLTREWAGKPDPAALTKLARFRFIAQVTHEGELSEPFALEGIQVEDTAGKPPAQSEEPVAGPVKRTEAAKAVEHLEGLDARILAELQGRGDGGGAGEGSPQRSEPDSAPNEPEGGLWVPGTARPER